jgi:hypothetical protein
MPTLAAPLPQSRAKNAMETVHKYLPCRFELTAPVAPDTLLNSLFPEASAAQEPCQSEDEEALEINRYLDILNDVFDALRPIY